VWIPSPLIFATANEYDEKTIFGRLGAIVTNFRLLFALILIAALGAGAYAWFSKQRTARTSDRLADGERANAGLLGVYKQLEKAAQTGDGNLFVSLMSQKKIDEARNTQLLERLRQGFPADPSVRYEVRGTKTRGDHAAILGKTVSSNAPPQYHLLKFILENGNWKLVEEGLNSEPIDPSALEAAIPPNDGAFVQAHSPWDRVPYASENTKWFKEDQINWKLKATNDESFVYIRFESKVPLPATGTELAAEDAKSSKNIPPTPDVMVIKTSTGKQFSVVVSDNPMTRATFDETGRAISNRYLVQYSFSLKDAARQTLFSDSTNETYDPLIAVHDQFVDIRVPLKCFGSDTTSTGIGMSEANSLAKILPYDLQRFSE
jgi:hypothetical protein